MEVDNCTLELKSSLKYYFAEEKQEHDYSQTAKAALYIVYLPSNLLVSTNINEMTWKQQQQQKMITVSLKKWWNVGANYREKWNLVFDSPLFPHKNVVDGLAA